MNTQKSGHWKIPLGLVGFISLKTIEINKYNMFNVYIVFTSMT